MIQSLSSGDNFNSIHPLLKNEQNNPVKRMKKNAQSSSSKRFLFTLRE